MAIPDAPLRVRRRQRSIDLVLLTPILGRSLRSELESCLRRLAGEPQPLPVVICGEHPGVFFAGADLREIARLTVHESAVYAQGGRRLAALLGRHPAPIVAAVRGTCAGGGFDLIMACDAVIAHPLATFAHPGVRRGLVTGWTGSTELPAALIDSAARRTFLTAAALDAASMSRLGLVLEVARDTISTARRTAVRLAGIGAQRRQLWRSMRGPRFVDRFRATVIHNL